MSTDEEQFESADISELLVGITPIYLNNFLQRGLFGLKASIQSGRVREKRRLFSRDDVFGISLVWLLFECGLRTDPIIRILKDITGTKKPDANLAARKLLNNGAECLLIIRGPRMPTKRPTEKPEQLMQLVRQTELADAFQRHAASNLLVVPVCNKFADVRKRMEILFGS